MIRFENRRRGAVLKEYSILELSSKELNRDVKVYISLPKNYFESDKYYPVVYMHDGQVIFNDLPEHDINCWGIMENYFNDPDLPELIMVGIASGDTRNDELLPVSVSSKRSGRTFGGKADDYIGFIINSLKPLIDKKYRTLKEPNNTGMIGISLGGICATYAAIKYTDYFTRFACISNAYMPNKTALIEMIKAADFTEVIKMYLDVGTNEAEAVVKSLDYIETNTEIYNHLSEKIDKDRLVFNIIKDSSHIEEDWAKRFPDIIKYMFKD